MIMGRIEVIGICLIAFTFNLCSALSSCCSTGITVGEQARPEDLIRRCEAINFEGSCKVEAVTCCKSVHSLHCDIGKEMKNNGHDCSKLGPLKKDCCNNHNAKPITDIPTTPSTKKTTKKPQKTCADISCDSLTTRGCVESSSGPKCFCASGFKLLEDGVTCQPPPKKDSCSTIKCDPKSTSGCKELADGPNCICKKGFKPMADGLSCQDIDECLESDGVRLCHQTYSRSTYCMNHPGYYQCVYRCPSPRYYQPYRNLRICKDVDECKTGGHTCDTQTHECQNVVGGFKCKRTGCVTGYKFVSGRCIDIDECALGTHKCNSQTHKCENKVGDYFCQPIDQCKVKPCSSGYYCHSYMGSRQCIKEECPNTKYYQQERNGKIAECSKRYCDQIRNPTEKQTCWDATKYPSSIKRYTYDYENEIKYNTYKFNYWWDFDTNTYSVDATLLGNESGHFYLQYVNNRSAVDIINQRHIRGPATYHLILQVDVKRRTYEQQLVWRFQVHLYVTVS